MKKKNLLLTAVATIGFAAATMGQSNCDLINSATFTVPNNSYQTLGPGIGCVNTNNPPNNAGTQVNVPVALNQWSLLTLTKASTNECKLYLNGNLIFTGNYANITYIWNSLKMGAGFGTSYYGYFKGYIDEVRLSNIVRTSSEIQNNFNSNIPFSQDPNTIGLWHFDQSNGTTVNSTIGATGSITNAVWSPGYFNNSLYFNGTNAYVNFAMSVPTSSFTLEAWVKPDGLQGGVLFQPYGINNADFGLNTYTQTTNYTWSTGVIGNSITVNPSTLPYIWVTDGNCTDTIWFNSQSATIYDTTHVTVTDTNYVTIYDTVTTYISVTDTLFIDINTVGLNNNPVINKIKVFPNPSNSILNLNYGNYATLNNYRVKITNALGQTIHDQAITQQSESLDLSTFGGNGIYYLNIINPQGNVVETRKIVLQ